MSTTWPQPDFLVAPTPHRPAIAWLWIAAALAVVVVALDDWRHAHHELDVQRERLAQALRRVPAATPGPSGAAAAAARPVDIESLRSAQAVIDRIRHPWDRILDNVEVETPDGLQWLALEHDADDPSVRLDGTARDVPLVLRFIDNLSDHTGWSDVVLERLRMAEGREAAATLPGWRFELHAGIDAHRLVLARPAGER